MLKDKRITDNSKIIFSHIRDGEKLTYGGAGNKTINVSDVFLIKDKNSFDTMLYKKVIINLYFELNNEIVLRIYDNKSNVTSSTTSIPEKGEFIQEIQVKRDEEDINDYKIVSIDITDGYKHQYNSSNNYGYQIHVVSIKNTSKTNIFYPECMADFPHFQYIDTYNNGRESSDIFLNQELAFGKSRVNIVNGEENIELILTSLPSNYVPINFCVFQRNSHLSYKQNNNLGKQWSHSFEFYIEINNQTTYNTGDYKYYVYYPNGEIQGFSYRKKYNDDGEEITNIKEYYCAENATTLIEDNSKTYLSLKDTTGNEIQFTIGNSINDSQVCYFILQKIINKAGKMVTFSYISNNLLGSITNDFGNINISYNENVISYITNTHNNEKIIFTYETKNGELLISQISKQYLNNSIEQDGLIFTYEYLFGANQITKIQDLKNNKLIQYTRSINKVFAITERFVGGTIDKTTSIAYDGLVRKVTLFSGEVLYYIFDKLNNLKYIQNHNGITKHKTYGVINKKQLEGYNEAVLSIGCPIEHVRNIMINGSLQHSDYISGENSYKWNIETSGSDCICERLEAQYQGKNIMRITISGNYVLSRTIVNSNLSKAEFSLKYRIVKNNPNVTIQILTSSGNIYSKTLKGTKGVWYPFAIDGIQLEDNETITLKINGTGSGVIEIAEMQFGQGISSKNNLVEDGYFDSDLATTIWTNDGYSTFNRTFIGDTEFHLSNIYGSKVLEVKNSGKTYQTIKVRGCKNDEITVAACSMCDTAGYYIRKINLIVHYNNKEVYKTYSFYFSQNNYSWETIANSIIAEDSFDEIKIEIETIGLSGKTLSSVYFDGIRLLINQFEKRYKYDENGFVKEAEYKKNIIKNGYNENYEVKEIESNYGSYHLSYDNNKNISAISNLNYNFNIDYSYNEKGDCILEETQYKNNDGIIFSNSRTTGYNQNSQIESILDEEGNYTYYSYDINGIINKIEYCEGLVFKVSESILYSDLYEPTKLMVENSEYSTFSTNNTFSYETSIKGLPNTYLITNGNKYQFLYTLNSQINEVKLKDKTNSLDLAVLMQNTYDSKGRLSSVKYGNSSYNTLYSYTYDDFSRITQELVSGTLYYTYEYNNLNQLTKIIDNYLNEISFYIYDNQGNIATIEYNSVYRGEYRFIYKYNQNGKIKNKIYDLESNELNYEYLYEDDTREKNCEYLYTILGKEYLMDIVDYGKSNAGKYGLLTYIRGEYLEKVLDDTLNRKVGKITSNSVANYIYLESANSARKDNVEEKLNNVDECRTITIWKKGADSCDETGLVIFTLSTTAGELKLRLYKEDLSLSKYKVMLYMSDDRTGQSECCLTKTIVIDPYQWNCFTFKINGYYDHRSLISTYPTISLCVNGKMVIDKELVPSGYALSDMGVIIDGSYRNYYIEDNRDSSLLLNVNKRENDLIGFVGVTFKNLTNKEMHEIYKLSSLYFTERSNNFQKSSGVTYINQMFSGYEVFTLEKTLESMNGLEPINFSLVDDGRLYKSSQCFEYDDDLQRFVYRSYNDGYIISNERFNISKLEYNPNLTSQGSIGVYFKEKMVNTNNKRIILSISNDEIIVYCKGNNELELSYQGAVTQLGTVLLNQWTHLVLTWNLSGNLDIYVNSIKKASITIPISYFVSKNISIGRTFNTNELYKEIDGVYHTLIIGYTYLSTITEYLKYCKLERYIKKYDSVGRLIKEEYQGNNNLVTEYSYDSNNHLFYLVNTQKLFNNEEISYKYDYRGKVIEISKGNDFTLYGYDYLGRLEKEYTSINNTFIYYRYNTNGNISSMNYYIKEYNKENARLVVQGWSTIYNSNVYMNGTIWFSESELQKMKNYTYNSIYVDQLIKVTTLQRNGATFETIEEQTLTYANPFDPTNRNPNTNTGAPTAIGNRSYTWNRGRLTKISYQGVAENIYSYNNEGIRIRKVIGTDIYNYVVEGNKVICYNKGSKYVYFNYDEKEKLIGFKYNGIDYIYIRDILGTINGIATLEGTIIVNYRYNSWGEIISREGNEELIEVNPFLYKGYLYDEETNYYYCNSRYYNPKWGRWITSDDLEYLDPSSINGLNPFVYCGNDPVNYFDPSGRFSWLALFIFIGVNLTFELIDDFSSDGQFLGDKNAWDYIGATVSGIIGAFDGNIAMQIGLSIIGGMTDAFLSGDIKEDGFINTLTSVTIFSLLSIVTGRVARGITSRVRTNSLKNMTKNSANKILKKMGMNLYMGSNRAKNNLFREIFYFDNWIGNILSESITSSVFEGVAPIGWSLIFDN